MSEHRDARRTTTAEIAGFFVLMIAGLVWAVWKLPPDRARAGWFGPLFLIEIYLRIRGPLVKRRPWVRRLTQRLRCRGSRSEEHGEDP